MWRMQNHLTPVEVLQRLVGPLPELERIAGYKEKSSYAWLRAAPGLGRKPGELPSVKLMQIFLTHAAAHDIPLTAEHLIWGAAEWEIDQLVAAMQSHVAAQ